MTKTYDPAEITPEIRKRQEQFGREIAGHFHKVASHYADKAQGEVILRAAGGLMVDIIASAPADLRMDALDQVCDLMRTAVRESLT